MYITLERAKEHLRVDFDDDDNYITSLIDVVEQAVSAEIGQPLAELEVAGVIPHDLQHSILLLLSHFYNVREPVTLGVMAVEVPYSYKYLIQPYKNWTLR